MKKKNGFAEVSFNLCAEHPNRDCWMISNSFNIESAFIENEKSKQHRCISTVD